MISMSHAQNRVDHFARCRVLACSNGGRSGSATGRGSDAGTGVGTGSGKGEVPGNASAIIPLIYAAGTNEGCETCTCAYTGSSAS